MDFVDLPLRDDFRGPRREGRALGPARDGDPRRGGRDAERVMSVDDGALRIRPPRVEGWGRTCLTYGPLPNRPGLAFSVFMLNGHNTSQAEIMADTLRSRLQRWAHGSGTVPVARRLWRWLRSGRVRRVLRQVRWWQRIAAGSSAVVPLDENLAVGFFPQEVCDPLRSGAGFVMHADGPRNGELWVGGEGSWAPAVLGVQNVPLHYVAIVRQADVVLGVSSLPGAHGAGAHPDLRVVGVVPRPSATHLHAGIQQAVLGQIGFRADTRVHGVRVAELPAWCDAGGGALARDVAGAQRSLAGRQAAVGGEWNQVDDFWRLVPAGPCGLVRLVLDSQAGAAAATVFAWRAQGAGDCWQLAWDGEGVSLALVTAGVGREQAAEKWGSLPDELQILDDGREIAVLARDRLLFGRRFAGAELAGQTALGFVAADGRFPAGLAAVEAFPRALPIPAELLAGAPWRPAPGAASVSDPLRGEPGDLHGRVTPVGGRTWRRLLGDGCLAVDATGAAWQASVVEPLPGRTVYALDWDDPGFAELEVTLTPPGSARGQREHGTAGFCLWQDADNHLLINTWLDDCYAGASLSSFFTIDGFEDLYDAIWTNVGERVAWGRPLRLKLVSDGLRYTVSIDGEPVLHRSLADVYPGCPPLRITKVGLLGNWEWGADTGSRFADFRAAGRGPGGI